MLERDWGADTLDRFRYQAEVTLPYCLAVVTRNKGILAVLPEHLEDIALQTDQGWRFLQVKSRNPERGLWTATDLLVQKGGALRSLYNERTYLPKGRTIHLRSCSKEQSRQTIQLRHSVRTKIAPLFCRP